MPGTNQSAARIWQHLSPVFIDFYHKNPYYGSLVFVDTETTGFDQGSDIIELGAISVEPVIPFLITNVDVRAANTLSLQGISKCRVAPEIGNGINSVLVKFSIFSELIYPRTGVYISQQAFKKHGISECELRKYGKPPKEALELFVEWIKSKSPDCLVAHNSMFDENMLYTDMMKYGINYSLPEFLCTVKMARKLKRAGIIKTVNAKLATLADYFDCPIKPKHRSISDAEACAYIFAKMMLLCYSQ